MKYTRFKGYMCKENVIFFWHTTKALKKFDRRIDDSKLKRKTASSEKTQTK